MSEVCECCGQEIPWRCEYQGCRKAAEYEGWFRFSPMIVRLLVCPEHIELSIGRKAGNPLP